ncbi:YbcC family protein [Rubellimicrobium arenae]|uniref:YbcC family protein n=1 Tax=Rubellimicrobium arenae TaxID=2817372 RepID=UPI001B316B73|nr:DUF2309 domain-containing protein [Rubellimicrobium arenae]
MIPASALPGPVLELVAVAEEAGRQVPPAFPLEATVAVNPFLGQVGESRATASARLARVAGVSLAQPRATYARMIAEGEITDADLAAALAVTGLPGTPASLRAAAGRPTPALMPLPTVADLAARVSGIDWPGLVAERIGLWAAGHFDRGQTLWPAPRIGAFASWHGFAGHDLTPEIAGLRGFAARVAALAPSACAALAEGSDTLGLGPDTAPTAFHRLHMALGGWSQLARGLDWQAGLEGRHDGSLLDLLAIRLVWEAALLDRYRDEVAADWTRTLVEHARPLVPSEDQLIDLALQEAADRAAERWLTEKMAAPAPTSTASRPAIQAVFCIDVRSEVFRRALETADPGIATLGFAGFFGLAAHHRPMASDLAEARGPALIPTVVQSTSSAASAATTQLRLHRRAVRAWGRFQTAAVSSFAFIEAAGPLYAAKLVRDALGHPAQTRPEPAPVLDLAPGERITAAARILRAMSLTRDFARVVLLAGHGSTVTNMPHASALQCGACGGHAGDVNARLLAGLLNEPATRAGLREVGIEIPADTLFVAGQHDTVSDALRLFDDHPAPGHAQDLARLHDALATAGRLARTERAARLPRAANPETLRRRGADWAELRPEWGLAGCSAFIAAPRARTAGWDLGGRAFLHSYDWRGDDGFAALELILTAPVVVASWIALQYHGSAVAPEVFGAGNKLLHNVTGGLGVVEGNGGLLRVGLPWQSVHDGDRLRHEPGRLVVVLEAPPEAISAVLERHPDVRALFDNAWLSLYAMHGGTRGLLRHEAGRWVPAGMDVDMPRQVA